MSFEKDQMFEELYSVDYSKVQLEKHKNRHTNHWRNHIHWAKKMVSEYKQSNFTTLLDLGCSVGTYAIEFALAGFSTYGLDLDEKALQIAERLAAEEKVNPTWICADAGDFQIDEPVDIILCFDLLEHLGDETIKGLLKSVRKNLKPEGIFVYHTFPTTYDHIFYRNLLFNRFTPILPIPLIPFSVFNDSIFSSVVKSYSVMLDLISVLLKGKTHKQVIKETVHPNPLSREKLDDLLENAGFKNLLAYEGIEDFNPLKPDQGNIAKKFFPKKSIAQRSLWGVACTKK